MKPSMYHAYIHLEAVSDWAPKKKKLQTNTESEIHKVRNTFFAKLKNNLASIQPHKTLNLPPNKFYTQKTQKRHRQVHCDVDNNVISDPWETTWSQQREKMQI